MTTNRILSSRYTIPLCGALVCAAYTLMYLASPTFFTRFMNVLIKWPGARPFADWSVTPSALKCWAQGVKVYLPNDCSLLFQYSPMWLIFPAPPGSPGWIIFFGFLFAVLFLAALACLPPPRTRTEFLVRLAATVSSGTILLLERGNVDILLFLLVFAGTTVACRPGALRLAGYGMLIFAALLKFYPAAALVVATRERVRTFILVFALSVASALGLAITFSEELRIILGSLPRGGEWAMEFRATALPGRIVRAFMNGNADASSIAAWTRAFQVVFTCLAVWFGIKMRDRFLPPFRDTGPTSVTSATRLFAVACAAILLFCFLFGQNFIYRGVFLLPILPLMFEARRGAGDPRRRFALSLTIAGMVSVLFVPTWKWLFGRVMGFENESIGMGALWLVYQLTWWWIAAVLFAITAAFISQSAVWKTVAWRVQK
jgi:hypothetical protein